MSGTVVARALVSCSHGESLVGENIELWGYYVLMCVMPGMGTEVDLGNQR